MARIVFDLDGTLVHSLPTLAACGNRLLAELGRPPVDQATYATYVGHGMAHQVRSLLDGSGGIPGNDLAPFIDRYRRLYAADAVSGTAAFAGVPEALATLRAAGHALGVCTQKERALAEQVIRGCGLDRWITGLTGGGDLPVLKPDPAMLAHAAGQLGPGPVIYVGDSETDAATAANADVPFLLFLGGYRHGPLPAAATFDDWRDLPGLVDSLLARVIG
jgi:phosphoglycolate phosphatase